MFRKYNIFILKILFLLSVFCTNQSLFAIESYDEKVIFAFDAPDWVAKISEYVNKTTTVKYLHKDESLINWSELIETKFIARKPKTNEHQELQTFFKGKILDICPTAQWIDLHETDNILISRFSLDACQNPSLFKYNLIAYVKGTTGIHTVHYATHDKSLFDKKMGIWQESFENIEILVPDDQAKDFNKQYLQKDKMIKIIYRYESPNIEKESFASLPRTFWRATNRYFRSVELEDTKNNIQQLIVVNEPDVWFVNLKDSTGKHMVDPGPTFNTVCPVFGEVKNDGLTHFEFGQELAFFKHYGAKQLPDRDLNTKKCKVYELTRGNWVLELYLDKVSNLPVLVKRVGSKSETMSVWYDSYEVGLVFDETLFKQPEGIKY